VIGNPPYISAPTMVFTNPEGRKTIADSGQYKTLYQKWDMYVPFMEFGLQMLRKGGVCAMIVPYPLTNQTYAKHLRELIVSQYNLLEIVDLNGTKVFENATVSNCIPFIANYAPQGECYISHINFQKQISRTFRQPFAALVQDASKAVWNLTQEKCETARHAEMPVLGDFCYISKGMVLNSDEKTAKGEFAKDDLICDVCDAIHPRPYIEAKDIEPYRVKNVRYLEYDTPRCPDKLNRPTFRELYLRKKLIMNCLGTINVAIDEGCNYLHNHSLSCAILWNDLKGVENKSITTSVKRYSWMKRVEMERLSEQVDLRYLLGILNSKYASVLLASLRGGDYHIYPEHLRNLPIPLADKAHHQPIISLVEQILQAKQGIAGQAHNDGGVADTSAQELQIDALVYKLYGLDYEEVKIIEPEFWLSESEYEAVKV